MSDGTTARPIRERYRPDRCSRLFRAMKLYKLPAGVSPQFNVKIDKVNKKPISFTFPEKVREYK